mmetsp:Transcript_45433/g.53203  ORF Transcript_45433/g.53203 Transcript_45433/m.53203 type:complete len:478 (-) Transcript_45433:556-1989(-)
MSFVTNRLSKVRSSLYCHHCKDPEKKNDTLCRSTTFNNVASNSAEDDGMVNLTTLREALSSLEIIFSFSDHLFKGAISINQSSSRADRTFSAKTEFVHSDSTHYDNSVNRIESEDEVVLYNIEVLALRCSQKMSNFELLSQNKCAWIGNDKYKNGNEFWNKIDRWEDTFLYELGSAKPNSFLPKSVIKKDSFANCKHAHSLSDLPPTGYHQPKKRIEDMNTSGVEDKIRSLCSRLCSDRHSRVDNTNQLLSLGDCDTGTRPLIQKCNSFSPFVTSTHSQKKMLGREVIKLLVLLSDDTRNTESMLQNTSCCHNHDQDLRPSDAMCFRSQGLSMPVRDSYLLSSSSLSLRRFGNEQVLDAQKLRVEKRNLFGTLTRPRGHHDLSYDMLNMRLRLPKAPFWLINDHDNNIHINGPLENYQRHLKEKDQDCRPLLCPQKSIEKTTRQFTKPQSLRPNHVQNTEKSEKFRSIHRTQSDVVP